MPADKQKDLLPMAIIVRVGLFYFLVFLFAGGILR